jgi:hypothetical protein
MLDADHVVAAGDETLGEEGADLARDACDENARHQLLSLDITL